MKKIAIIAAILLTTGVTAFSLTRKENKADVKIENVTDSTTDGNAKRLATAD
ncbi:hypothetical protein [Mucilaginibacter sp. UYCu711]|uniref:hypothetical protein n=1 Tax=Mucilaginibacter sp. UYCu711 TaxID=3156339 RepID=UPI003D255E69